MTDEAKTTDLVTEPAPARAQPVHETHVITDPVVTIDAAAALDPAKAKPKPPKAKRRRKAPGKRAAKARDTAAVAAKVKAMEQGKAAKAQTRHATASVDEARAAYEAAKHGRVAAFADMPEGDLTMRFANGDEFITGESIDVPREHLSVADGRATYGKQIDFEADAPRAFVKDAWLIAESGEAMVCEVGIGMTVGGGYHGRIPAGHLLF